MYFVGATPLGKHLQDVWWIAVNLGESSVDMASIKVRGLHTIGAQLASRFEAEIDQPLTFGFEVGHQIGAVVIALLPRLIHLAIDRRRVVVLRDELNHGVTEVAERIRDIGFLVGAPIGEFVARVMFGHRKRTGPVGFVPIRNRLLEIVDEVRLLKYRIRSSQSSHQTPLCRSNITVIIRATTIFGWTSGS